jgi:hypothetical protein
MFRAAHAERVAHVGVRRMNVVVRGVVRKSTSRRVARLVVAVETRNVVRSRFVIVVGMNRVGGAVLLDYGLNILATVGGMRFSHVLPAASEVAAGSPAREGPDLVISSWSLARPNE